jgi:hypothetical protein
MKAYFLALIIIFFPALVSADELTSDALVGNWLFTHMILDGESQRAVNMLMEFLPNGEVINYIDASGNELNRASYEITPESIIYTDENGVQTWQVVELSNNNLHVDNSGAEMFFTKQ